MMVANNKKQTIVIIMLHEIKMRALDRVLVGYVTFILRTNKEA